MFIHEKYTYGMYLHPNLLTLTLSLIIWVSAGLIPSAAAMTAAGIQAGNCSGRDQVTGVWHGRCMYAPSPSFRSRKQVEPNQNSELLLNLWFKHHMYTNN